MVGALGLESALAHCLLLAFAEGVHSDGHEEHEDSADGVDPNDGKPVPIYGLVVAGGSVWVWQKGHN